MTDRWEQAQAAEIAWWGHCEDTQNEEMKQRFYGRCMGLDTYLERNGLLIERYNLRGRSVLDLGGGPASLLLRCQNRGRGTVVDPAHWPDWVYGRYRAAGIEYVSAPAEDVELTGWYDEVWLYNVLQHVRDPQAVVATAKRYGGTIRVFEWLDVPESEQHPHRFTKEQLDAMFGCCGRRETPPWQQWPGYSAVIQGEHSKPFRAHMLGMAHLPTTPEYQCCAYTQKLVKLARMLTDIGYEVIFYGVEGSEVACQEQVTVLSEAERVACYGEYDWRKEFFKWEAQDAAHQTFNANAIPEVAKRKRRGDFLLCQKGWYDKPVADAVGGDMHVVESGIGYTGVFADKRVFESYAWLHHIYGLKQLDNGIWYDVVIPNYFEPEAFPFQATKGDYVLYIGRVAKRKGIELVVQVTDALKLPLIVAGQGSLVNPAEHLDITAPHVTHVGAVGSEERARLMGGARCVMAPTYYIEPFGGVAVEAQMCGTPVITTDWGAFPETVLHGITGWRCRTFEQFCWAVEHSGDLQPEACRTWAVQNYTTSRVAWMYDEYFRMLNDIMTGGGWYERHDDRAQLDWLRKEWVSR